MDNSAILVAIIIAIPMVLVSILIPIGTMFFQARNSLAEREAEWRRQDLFETRRVQRYDITASTLVMASKATAEATIMARTEVNDKLDTMHTLLNSSISSKTRALQRELDSTLRELALMIELLDIKRSIGKEPTAESLAAISVAEHSISDLRADLQARHEAEAAAKEKMKDAENTKIIADNTSAIAANTKNIADNTALNTKTIEENTKVIANTASAKKESE